MTHTISKEQAIEDLRSMSYEIAYKYINRGVPLDDLVQAGYEGILIAHGKYDPLKAASFSTYARYWIIKLIYDTVNDEGRSIRFPVWYRDQRIVPVMAAQAEWFQKFSKEPTLTELADALGWDVAEVDSALHWGIFSPVEFDAEDSTLEIIDKAEMGDPEIQAETELLKRDINFIIDLLGETEAEVIKRRFGFFGEEQTLRQVSEAINLSYTAVYRIEKTALNILRKHPDARSIILGWRFN